MSNEIPGRASSAERCRGLAAHGYNHRKKGNRMNFARSWQVGGTLSLAAGLLVGAPAGGRPATPAAAIDASAWIMNYDEGKAASQRSKKPILLVIR
jgi:hypothetical protein